ncbi:MAG: methionyl-tRNA formyltransferase [Candidatus Omnitrophota bacterium]|jgi:methionyl-tRNA formyltransferase
MNIVFFGSAHFGVASLKEILRLGLNVSAVVTVPDKPKGRGMHLSATLVKETAQGARIPVFQPAAVNDEESVRYLKSLRPDLFIIIAYGQILSQEVLDIPRIISINAHASVLPKYRGAAPINWAIINGEKTTGVSIIKVIRKMDAGPVLLTSEVPISNEDTAVGMEKTLSVLTAQLVVESIGMIVRRDFTLIPQDESRAVYAPKLKKEDGLINWQNTAEAIQNHIRGCLPWPGSFTYYRCQIVKIYKTAVLEAYSFDPLRFRCGSIVHTDKKGIVVATGQGCIRILELQLQGKRLMSAEEFIAGHKIQPGEEFGKK